MEEKKRVIEGQVAREDPSAVSARPDLPAFLAPSAGSPVYHGFPLLPNSQKEGLVFGVITNPRPGATWGDAYVVAPDGSRAGMYQFHFEPPVDSDADLIRNLHAILPRLKELYAAAKSTMAQ